MGVLESDDLEGKDPKQVCKQNMVQICTGIIRLNYPSLKFSLTLLVRVSYYCNVYSKKEKNYLGGLP